jgi:protein-S-isoprenylcysteine O-methyltransferase Ste14
MLGAMTRDMLKAILILPGTALVYVPALIVWLTSGGRWAARPAEGWMLALAILLAIPGLVLMFWTMRLFMTRGGGGTPAPWAPVRRLVVEGPYRHARNPMLTGVILFQLAEAAALRSWPLLAWAVAFFALNTVYFILSEEPGLERRFGAAYRRYKAAVPRWIPRRTPWEDRGEDRNAEAPR